MNIIIDKYTVHSDPHNFIVTETKRMGTKDPRNKYFAEINNGVGAIGPDANVINFTTTLDYAKENLNLKLEYRLDKASEQVFEQKDNLSSIVLAAVYSFN